MVSGDGAVDIQGLSRRFRGKNALHEVNMQIPVGSVFGLVGLNGAGKTTLIRHIIGAYKAQQGRVVVLGGDPVVEPQVVLKKIGYLTEEDSLPRWMRVGDLIDFSRAIYPTWDEAYAKRLCEQFELSRKSNLSDLSKGQRARAGLLVAIAHRPQLLVLDEPSSGLDPVARGDILEAIIRTISDEGRTVLFSSHLLDEVERVCDCIAMMHEGQIVESLTIDQLQDRYCEVIGLGALADVAGRFPQAFGWRQIGEEWSVVVGCEWLSQQVDSRQFGVIERRDISLERWFLAHAAESKPKHQVTSGAGGESYV